MKIPEAFAAEVEELLNDIPDGVISDAPEDLLLKAILRAQIHTNYLLAMIACIYMHQVEKEEEEMEDEKSILGLGREDNVV